MILSVRLSNALIGSCQYVGKTVSWRWSKKAFNFGNLLQVTIARSRYHAMSFRMVTFLERTDCEDSLTPVAFNLTQVGCPRNKPANLTKLASTGLIATGFNPNFLYPLSALIPCKCVFSHKQNTNALHFACSTGGAKLNAKFGQNL